MPSPHDAPSDPAPSGNSERGDHVSVPHSHAALDATVPVGRRPRLVLSAALICAALLSVIGVVALWPDSAAVEEIQSRAELTVPGVTFPNGQVLEIQDPCPAAPLDVRDLPPEPFEPGTCGSLVVQVTEGVDAGETILVDASPQTLRSAQTGDTVRLGRTPPLEDLPPSWSYVTTERGPTLGLLALAFAVIVLAVARVRGLMAMLGLVFSGVVLLKFILPAILAGGPGVPITLSGTMAIMFVVLYTTHGFSMRTSAALAGTLIGIALTAAIGWYIIGTSRLSGLADDSGWFLAGLVDELDFQELLLCSLIVFGLGVLNDVTIAQSSAVWELRAAAPEQSRLEIFRSGMRIGRDHIASTIYTIVFAYAGAALFTLLLITMYRQSLLDLVSTEEIAVEIARTLASGIGLVLAVPATTGIAALVVAGGRTGV